MKVVWTRPALRDLDSIATYIGREDPAASRRVLARIAERARDLRSRPHRGRRGRAPNTHELVVDGTSYIVVYRIEGDRADILAVYHGARRWPEDF